MYLTKTKNKYRFRILADGGIYDQHEYKILGWIEDQTMIQEIWDMNPSSRNKFLAEYIVKNNISL